MANQQHLDLLRQGVDVWNRWQKEHLEREPDFTQAKLSKVYLSGANLNGANLFGADLSGVYLSRANLSGAYLSKADLRRADLSGALLNGADLNGAILNEAILSGTYLLGTNLSEASLIRADLSRAHLSGADLSRTTLNEAILSEADLRSSNLRGSELKKTNFRRADLSSTNLSDADLGDADLTWANLSEAYFTRTNLTGCSIYAISAWNVHLDETIQLSLIITRREESTITVDNLEMSQFIYLLLNNQKIRDVIDTITSKVVLILGRFTPERKAILDALRDELRKRNYSPVLFDFEKPVSRDLTGTVSTLAHLARFIIVDLTDPSSAPHEVATVIPQTVVHTAATLTRATHR